MDDFFAISFSSKVLDNTVQLCLLRDAVGFMHFHCLGRLVWHGPIKNFPHAHCCWSHHRMDTSDSTQWERRAWQKAQWSRQRLLSLWTRYMESTALRLSQPLPQRYRPICQCSAQAAEPMTQCVPLVRYQPMPDKCENCCMKNEGTSDLWLSQRATC